HQRRDAGPPHRSSPARSNCARIHHRVTQLSDGRSGLTPVQLALRIRVINQFGKSRLDALEEETEDRFQKNASGFLAHTCQNLRTRFQRLSHPVPAVNAPTARSSQHPASQSDLARILSAQNRLSAEPSPPAAPPSRGSCRWSPR